MAAPVPGQAASGAAPRGVRHVISLHVSGVRAGAGPEPLLERAPFFPFNQVDPSHVVPGMKQVLAELEAEPGQPWRLTCPHVGRALSLPWSASATGCPSPGASFSTSRPSKIPMLFARLSKKSSLASSCSPCSSARAGPSTKPLRPLRKGTFWGSLSEAQRRIVDAELESAKASGVALEGAEKERFNAIQQELAELSRKFR